LSIFFENYSGNWPKEVLMDTLCPISMKTQPIYPAVAALILFLSLISAQVHGNQDNTTCQDNASGPLLLNMTSMNLTKNLSLPNISSYNMTDIADNLSISKNTSADNLGMENESSGEKNTDDAIRNASSMTDRCTFFVYSDRLIYKTGQKVEILHNLSDCSDDFSIEYWIEDLFKNIAKNPYTTTNKDKKTWTAKTGRDVDVFRIRSVMTQHPGTRNSTEQSSERIIIVLSDAGNEDSSHEQEPDEDQKDGQDQEPKIDIISIKHKDDDHARFGELIKVRVLMGRGGSARYSIKAWIEDKYGDRITGKHTINIKEKNVDLEIELSMQIEPDCEKEFMQGTYYLIFEGLGIKREEEIEIEGWEEDLCGKIEPECPICEICPTQEEEKEDDEENEKSIRDCICSQSQENKIIKSFYTLQKKPSDDIKLFTNFNFIPNSSIKAVILSIRNRSSVPFEDDKQTTIMPLQEKGNDFILMAMKNNTVIDYEELSFFNNMTKSPIEDEQEQREQQEQKNQQIDAAGTGTEKSAQHDSLKTITSAEIASPIYESTQEKTKRFSFIGFGIVLLLLSYIGAKRFLFRAIRRYMKKSPADSE
jgi:hypothetical protein